MLRVSLVSGFWGFTRTIRGIGSARVLVTSRHHTCIYIYTRINQHVYIYIYICNQWSKAINEQQRLKTCYDVHSCLGCWDTLDQYKAREARVLFPLRHHTYIYIRLYINVFVNINICDDA